MLQLHREGRHDPFGAQVRGHGPATDAPTPGRRARWPGTEILGASVQT
jgi:hypothetical protein